MRKEDMQYAIKTIEFLIAGKPIKDLDERLSYFKSLCKEESNHLENSSTKWNLLIQNLFWQIMSLRKIKSFLKLIKKKFVNIMKKSIYIRKIFVEFDLIHQKLNQMNTTLTKKETRLRKEMRDFFHFLTGQLRTSDEEARRDVAEQFGHIATSLIFLRSDTDEE